MPLDAPFVSRIHWYRVRRSVPPSRCEVGHPLRRVLEPILCVRRGRGNPKPMPPLQRAGLEGQTTPVTPWLKGRNFSLCSGLRALKLIRWKMSTLPPCASHSFSSPRMNVPPPEPRFPAQSPPPTSHQRTLLSSWEWSFRKASRFCARQQPCRKHCIGDGGCLTDRDASRMEPPALSAADQLEATDEQGHPEPCPVSAALCAH